MNKHFKISLIKSLIRIFGCVTSNILLCINCINISIITLGSSLFIAEGLGILEEILDPRK